MKYIIILLLLTGCSIKVPNHGTSLNEEINKSIADGFFDGDTTQVYYKIKKQGQHVAPLQTNQP
jgi:hypothetical protein